MFDSKGRLLAVAGAIFVAAIVIMFIVFVVVF
jgi:hypothetical protein